MQLLIVLSLMGNSLALLWFGTTQSVAVTGRLTCDGQPAVGVKVKLYEKELMLDVKLDENVTDANGAFYLSGSKKEISAIDPKVNIYHKCHHTGYCYRKFGITIPDEYITKGEKPEKTYDIGDMVLENRFSGETTDCLN